jgi:predicted P-loop ATPase
MPNLPSGMHYKSHPMTHQTQTYSILNHLEVLTPSKGSKTKYHCPVCNSPNLDIQPRTGAYSCFTNNCTPKEIRTAIDKLQGKPQFIPYQNPIPSHAWIKPIRPAQTTVYYYPTRDSQPLVQVKRIDSGDGSKKQFPQQHYDKATKTWKSTNPPHIKRQIPIYDYPIVQQAIQNGDWIWTVEGESTVEKLKEQGIVSTTTIGGSGGFHNYGSYDRDLIDAMLISTPDRDLAGIKYSQNYIDLFPNQIVGVYLAGNIEDWRNGVYDGRDIVDDINEFGYTAEQLLERVISVEEYLEIIAPKPQVNLPKNTKPHIDYAALAIEMGYPLDEEASDEHGKLISKVTKLKLDILRKQGKALRYNLMTREIEYKGKTLDLNRAKLRCADMVGYDSPTESCLQALMEISELHQYHPVEEYLKSLDSTQPNDKLLSNIATVFFGNDDPLANLMMRRKLIGAVARVMSPGIKDDSLLILQGKQGTFKSSFLRALTGDDWFCDNLMSLEHKDELAKLSQHWILELAEVDYMFRKKETELFKRFLSAQSDMFRPPYGRSNVKVPRTCSFWATTNKQEFLTDPTGNRRYWVVEVKQRINLEAVKEMRNVIWASALAAYQGGEIFHLTPSEDYQLETINSNWTDDEDPWMNEITKQIAKYLNTQGNTQWIEISTIMDKILGIPLERQDKRQRNRIGVILQLAGFTRKTLRLGELGVKKVWCLSESEVRNQESEVRSDILSLSNSQDLGVLPITLLEEMGNGMSNSIGNSQNLDISTELPLLPLLPIIEANFSDLKNDNLEADLINSEKEDNNLSNLGNDISQSEAESDLSPKIKPVTHPENSNNNPAKGNNQGKTAPSLKVGDKVRYVGGMKAYVGMVGEVTNAGINYHTSFTTKRAGSVSRNELERI